VIELSNNEYIFCIEKKQCVIEMCTNVHLLTCGKSGK